jgi:hypothetical protein
MAKSTKTPSDREIGSRDLLIASLITAVWLGVFVVGYWGGRDIGSMLFN